MSNTLLAAAVLALAIGVVHSWLGERRLIMPLLDPERGANLLARSGFARQTLRFAWHITTLAWWGLAAILVALAVAPIDATGRLVLAVIAVTFAITGLVTLATSRGRHLAWPIFFLIAALAARPLWS